MRLIDARLYYICRDRPAGRRSSSPRCAAAWTSSSCATSTPPTTSCCARPRSRGALCDEHGALFVLNDRPDLAVAAGADGVHLGQDDMPLAAGARDRRARRAGRPLDAHAPSRSTARGGARLHRRRARSTPPRRSSAARRSGLELVRYAAAHASVPFFAIGGIDARRRCPARSRAGATRAAVVRAISEAPDPEAAARALRAALAVPVG